jgi:hypothetical protein
LERVNAFKETPTYQNKRLNERINALEKSHKDAVGRLSQMEAGVRELQTWRQTAAEAQDGLQREMTTPKKSLEDALGRLPKAGVRETGPRALARPMPFLRAEYLAVTESRQSERTSSHANETGLFSRE